MLMNNIEDGYVAIMALQIKCKMHSNKRYQNCIAQAWFTPQEDLFVDHNKPLMGCRIVDAVAQ